MDSLGQKRWRVEVKSPLIPIVLPAKDEDEAREKFIADLHDWADQVELHIEPYQPWAPIR